MKTNEPVPPTGPMTRAEDLEIVRCTTVADYDGTTLFARMTPRERLQWLDLAVDFVARHAKAARRGSG